MICAEIFCRYKFTTRIEIKCRQKHLTEMMWYIGVDWKIPMNHDMSVLEPISGLNMIKTNVWSYQAVLVLVDHAGLYGRIHVRILEHFHEFEYPAAMASMQLEACNRSDISARHWDWILAHCGTSFKNCTSLSSLKTRILVAFGYAYFCTFCVLRILPTSRSWIVYLLAKTKKCFLFR